MSRRVSKISSQLAPLLFVVVAPPFLLQGCAVMDLIGDQRPGVDTRTVLPRGQILQVNSYDKLTKTGQRIDDFRCTDSPMWCSGNGVTRDCSCP